MSWRARNPRQAKDKQTIYNSREWRELRTRKLRANPLCEICEQKGITTAAHQVHHIHPIEDSHSVQEMRKWAFMYENLQSVCDQCHNDIHKSEGKGTKALAIERAKQRHDRWADGLIKRFTKNT